MNSELRLLALGVAALASTACATRQNSMEPPTFPSGGLVARGVPPPNPWSLENVLEGVYNTTSRFGSDVVIHASQYGGISDGMKASVSILAYDHFAFANMEPACFIDTSSTAIPPVTQLVLEGYWRNLDVSDPTPESTGLIRLFVGPQSLVDYVCQAPAWHPGDGPGDPRPAPTAVATFRGTTGSGSNAPAIPLSVDLMRARRSRLNSEGKKTFFVGVHHGACQTVMNCGISENTPETAILSVQLGGEYLEIDTHLTKDGVPVFFHLSLSPDVVQGAYCTGAIEDFTYAELLANCRLRNGEVIPRVEDMLAYVFTRTNLPTYLDSKTTNVIVPVSQIMEKLAARLVPCPTGVAPPGKACLYPGSIPVMERGIIGLPSADFVTTYQAALLVPPGQPGHLAPGQHCLVEENISDAIHTPCVSWMPRYTRGPMANDVRSAQMQGLFVGFWTINDPATMDAFLTQSVPNGFLTNYLGVANQRFEMVGIVPPYTPYRVTTP
ncbi:MAG: glycerophosphodiester phosphodiesterase family protein [Deltaproteobacteria bacterium]